MKTRMMIMSLILLLVSAFAFYVYAQDQSDRDSSKAIRVAPVVVIRGQGIGIATADVVLCKTDGSILFGSFPGTGTLRIEYKNGSMSQIDLWDVKKMTVTALPMAMTIVL